MALNLELVRKRRRELDLSQTRAAELAGFKNRQQWFQIESGERSDIRLSTLAQVAKVLKLKAAELIAEE